MFHQTLFPSSFPSSPSPPPPPPFPLSSRFFNSSSTSFPLPLAPLHQPSLPPPLLSSSCSQVGREPAMEDGGLWKKGMVSEEEVERGNFSGEGFSVDDLLNLGDYAENDKAAEEETEAAEEIKVEAKVEATEAESRGSVDSDTSSSSSSLSSTSALSFEMPRPPPLAEITLPAHDAEELEWVSLIMEDSISEIPPCPGLAHYASTPPTQGLNEASAAAATAEETEKNVALSRSAASKSKRSKRYRSAAAWSMSALHPFADSPSVTAPATSSSVSSSTSCLIYTRHTTAGGGQSFLLHGVPPHPARNPGSKKRGRKPKHPAPRSGSGERRCSHCGVQKTPQWRAGPLGAKTLCNACGVRFKSGRLLPEYRPACSPTFVSHIHSNSHRKVLEMRRKKEAELVLSPAGPPVASF